MSEHAIINSYVRDKNPLITDAKGIGNDIIKKVMDEKLPYLIKNGKKKGSMMAIPLRIRSEVFGILVSLKKDEASPTCQFSRSRE